MVVMNTYDVSSVKIDMLKRWISVDALSMLHSVTSRVLRLMHAMEYGSETGPLLYSSLAGAEVVLFSGGIGSGPLLAGFLHTQCCAYLAILSEVQGESLMASAALSTLCVLVKPGHAEDIYVVHSTSWNPTLKVIKKHVGNIDDLLYEMQKVFVNGLAFGDITRNVIINNDLKCNHFFGADNRL